MHSRNLVELTIERWLIIASNIKVEKTKSEGVDNFYYQGSIMTNDNRCSTEIGRRITMAKQASLQKRQQLINKSLNINKIKQFVTTFVIVRTRKLNIVKR